MHGRSLTDLYPNSAQDIYKTDSTIWVFIGNCKAAFQEIIYFGPNESQTSFWLVLQEVKFNVLSINIDVHIFGFLSSMIIEQELAQRSRYSNYTSHYYQENSSTTYCQQFSTLLINPN